MRQKQVSRQRIPPPASLLMKTLHKWRDLADMSRTRLLATSLLWSSLLHSGRHRQKWPAWLLQTVVSYVMQDYAVYCCFWCWLLSELKKRMFCRDLIPWVVGHCECSFGPLRRSVCRCCGSSARVFFPYWNEGFVVCDDFNLSGKVV